jgi:hypothetical protein
MSASLESGHLLLRTMFLRPTPDIGRRLMNSMHPVDFVLPSWALFRVNAHK